MKSKVSATHIYKTYAEHTLLFSFHFSPVTFLSIKVDVVTSYGVAEFVVCYDAAIAP